MSVKFIKFIFLFLAVTNSIILGESDDCSISCVEYVPVLPQEWLQCSLPGKLYLGVFGGADQIFSRVRDSESTSVLDPRLMGGCCLGYKFHRFFRAEGEFAYRNSSHNFPYSTFSKKVYSGMFNFYLEAPILRLTPFVGFGLGYSDSLVKVTESYNFCYSQIERHKQSFAQQLVLGVNYRIFEKTDLGIKQIMFFQSSLNDYHVGSTLSINQYF